MLWRVSPRSRRSPPAGFILPAQPTRVGQSLSRKGGKKRSLAERQERAESGRTSIRRWTTAMRKERVFMKQTANASLRPALRLEEMANRPALPQPAWLFLLSVAAASPASGWSVAGAGSLGGQMGTSPSLSREFPYGFLNFSAIPSTLANTGSIA